jgi:diacylglycerol kinase (ATP)
MMGFGHAWNYEAAFRQEVAITVVLVPFALLLGRTGVERVILIGSCLLVLIVELLNSAIETVVDRVGDEHHVLSGRAKDLGSAAVFVSLLVVMTVWVTVAAQRFLG